jgi:hypothetical protein
MKVEKREIEIQRSDDFQEQAMGLAKGSESFIFNVLRKDLYSDPVGSLLREYSVNAQDEHRKFNIDKPILIQAPTSFNPELHIRDYANGLTEAQVMEFFGQYGASDKRDSNDVVGFYGLGAKSAFSYTDSYVVKSFKDGKVYTFNIYIDETEIGRVAKLSEEATEESNGIEIIVPVKVKDVADFQRKAVATAQYFKVKPTFEGLTSEPVWDVDEAKIEGDGWKFMGGSGEALCIMGEIAYPINQYAIDDLLKWEEGLLDSNLHLFLNIGDVQVTASREALQMSEKTIKAIRAKLVEVKDAMVQQTQEAFLNAKNLFEAKSLFYTLVRRGEGFGQIIKDSGVDLIWNGITIEDNAIKLDGNLHSITHYTKKRKRGTYYQYAVKENAGVTTFRVGEETNIFFDDVPDKRPMYKRRAETLIIQGDAETASFIHTKDVAKLEEELGTPVSVFQSLKDVTPAPLQTTGSRGNLADKKKHLAKVFRLDVDKLMGNGYRIASEVWEVKTVRKGGIYIPINRFKPELGRITELSELRDALVSLKKLGVKIPTAFYGLKNTDSTDGMISFNDWYKRKAETLTKHKETMALSVSYSDSGDAFDVRALDETKVTNMDTQEYIKMYKEAYKAYYETRYEHDIHRVFRLANIEVKPSVNLEEMSEKVVKHYPLLPIIDDLSDDRVMDYMAMMDGKIVLDKSSQDSVALDG